MGKREERRAAKRQLMLDTAMAIVNERGLEALTIARLAGRIDAAVGALYRYFDSKEALIAELELEYIHLFYDAMQADLAHANGVIEAREGLGAEAAALLRVLIVFHSFLLDARREPARHQMMDTFLSAPHPVLTDEQAIEVDKALAPVFICCVERLDAAVECGALAPGSGLVRTYVLWAGLHGLDHFRKRDRILPADLHSGRILDALFRSLLTGWGGDAEAIESAIALLPEASPPIDAAPERGDRPT